MFRASQHLGQHEGRDAPLFYRKRVSSDGRTDELAVGAAGVRLIRWLVVLVVVLVILTSGHLNSTSVELLRVLVRFVMG
jgi:hypothetical protein